MRPTPKLWDDEGVMAGLLEEFSPLKANPGNVAHRINFWKEFVTGFTRQRNQAIFSVESLERRLTRNNARLPWLKSVIKDLCQDGVLEPAKRKGWLYKLASLFFYTDVDQVYFNVETIAETCRAVQVVIKAQYIHNLEVPYDYMWGVCRDVCEGNEQLFQFVLKRLPDISVQEDVITIDSKSNLLSSEPCVGHDEALKRLREAVHKIREMLALFESSGNGNILKGDPKPQSECSRRAPIQLEVLPMLLNRLQSIEVELEKQRTTSADHCAIKVNAAVEQVDAAKTVIEIVERIEAQLRTKNQSQEIFDYNDKEFTADSGGDTGVYSDYGTNL